MKEKATISNAEMKVMNPIWKFIAFIGNQTLSKEEVNELKEWLDESDH